MNRLEALLLGGFAASIFGCGAETPSAAVSQVSRGGGGEATESSVPSAGADSIPLPSLPEPAPAPEQARVAPTIGDLATAEAALASGFYEAVTAALPRLGGESGARAALLEARLAFETGRYDAVAAPAERAARDAAYAIPARTVAAEAHVARGRYAQAESTFEAVVADASATRARVLLGRLLGSRGKEAEARARYFEVIGAYNDGTIDERDAEGLTAVAMAASELGSARDANDAFGQASRADPARPETHLEWARLFLSKYDAGHAEESVSEVLSRNPDHPLARALLARIRIAQSYDFVAAREESERALRINPSLVLAHVTLAGIALRDLDVAGADAHLDRALAVDPEDLEALSVRAAVRYLAGDARGFERARAAVLQRNPRYSRLYSIIAEYADWEHRYPDLVRFAREAVTLDPTDALAHATLGLNLLRMGDEAAGLTALREAWRRDRYNVLVYNTLNLYDDVIGPSYETLERGPFSVRMHREERPLLERYVPELLETAHREMVRRYRFTPDGPIGIELYADPEHFSVRTAGLPRIGVQGVCFGKVVTALSPRGGHFNWAQITWHELAHVFHIQLSRNRVPRWFTEGLAEHETLIAERGWRRELDHALSNALEADRLPPLALLNRAFTGARSADEVMVAYYASSLVVGYIAERFGMDAVVAMLRAWGRDRSTEEVFEEALGVSIEEVDRDFRVHLRERLATQAAQVGVDFQRFQDLESARRAAEANPRDASAQAARAAAALVRGLAEEASAAARAALALDPGHAIALVVLARLAIDQRPEEAKAHLARLLDGNRDGYDIRRLAARAALGLGDHVGALAHLRAASRLSPRRAEAWRGIAELAERAGDAEAQLEALRALADIDEHGREVHGELLDALVARGEYDAAVASGERAIHVDPGSPGVHLAFGEALLHTRDPRRALFEFESAAIADARATGRAQLGRARALLALRRRSAAEEAGRAAIAADPSLEAEVRAALER